MGQCEHDYRGASILCQNCTDEKLQRSMLEEMKRANDLKEIELGQTSYDRQPSPYIPPKPRVIVEPKKPEPVKHVGGIEIGTARNGNE